MPLRKCELCRKDFPESDVFTADQIRPAVQKVVSREAVGWTEKSLICEGCLDRCRVLHLQDLIEEERGELSALDERVLQSLSEHETVARNVGAAYEEKLSLGQRMSDKLASFGGSWSFLIIFSFFLFAWICFNELGPSSEKFDPFPYILLNLLLSCIAAIQAPIIMMSQNRQEAKDRLRGEHDYEVNLKAELEIRQLHMKIDQLLRHQWSRLLEIQQLQFELMSQNRRNFGKGPDSKGDSHD